MSKLTPENDLVFSMFDDAAYMAVLDLNRYAQHLPDWDYDSLTEAIVRDMNAGAIVAWGSPEAEVQVRITMRELSEQDGKRVVATMRAHLSTSGSLCLAGYTSLTMCAQFENDKFPQRGDQAFDVESGEYSIAVHRFFAHSDGAQDPDEELPAGDHYVVVFGAPGATTASHAWVPWALKP